MTGPVTRVAAELANLRRTVEGFARTPQLANSSLEDGFVDEYDIDGNIGSRWGTQFDQTHGTFSLRGPEPPAPTAPTVTPILHGLKIAWDGFFVDDAIVPMDFSRVEVHVADVPDFGPDTALTLRATIETPRGAEVLVAFAPDAPEQYVKMVTRSLPGNFSEASEEIAATPGSTELLPALGTKIYYGSITPTDPLLGELWYEEVDAGPPPTYEAKRWDGDSWEPLADEGAAIALAEAVAAAEAAGENARFFHQNSAPTNPPSGSDIPLRLYDYWLDADDGNRVYRWNGSAWSAARFGNSAITPNSLVASSVLVTGSITAALLAASIVTADKMVVGTITAASAILAAASVVDANIQSLTAAKITAGTMAADVVVGGKLTTALSGQRVEMTNAGFTSYGAGSDGLHLDASVNARASTPDDPALDITGDLDIRVLVSMDDWTPGVFQHFVGKGGPAGQSSYMFRMTSGNALELRTTADGSTNLFATSLVSTGFADGTMHWIRVTMDVNDGAGNRVTRFYTSEDGVNWTEINNRVQAGATSIFNSTTPVEIGARGDNTERLIGKIHYVEIRNGINGPIVANPDFAAQNAGTSSFADTSGRTWTIHPPAAISGSRVYVDIPATGGATFSGTISTALSGARAVLEAGSMTGTSIGDAVLRLFSGAAAESRPAEVVADQIGATDTLSMYLASPTTAGHEAKRAMLQMIGESSTMPSTIWITADLVRTTGLTSVWINSTVDASIASGNQPALKIGPEDAAHLRFDQGEILAMTDEDTPATLALNHSFASSTPTRTFGGAGTVGDPQNKGDVVIGGLIQVLNNARAIGSGGSFGNRGVIRSHSSEYNCSIRFSEGPVLAGEVDIMIRNANTWAAVRALAFNATSSKAVKKDFREPGWSALSVVRNAPSKLWKYDDSFSESNQQMMGPVAEDLPPELVHQVQANDGDPMVKGVDLMSMIGLLWRTVRELDEELDLWRKEKKKPLPVRKK